MSEPISLSGEDAELWYTRAEESPAIESLLRETTVDLSFDAFERSAVKVHTGVVTVSHYHEETEGNYVQIQCRFDEAEGTLNDAEIDDGYIAAPLAGNGFVWTYTDGEVTEKGRWIS